VYYGLFYERMWQNCLSIMTLASTTSFTVSIAGNIRADYVWTFDETDDVYSVGISSRAQASAKGDHAFDG
jgi:hypothetical protein